MAVVKKKKPSRFRTFQLLIYLWLIMSHRTSQSLFSRFICLLSVCLKRVSTKGHIMHDEDHSRFTPHLPEAFRERGKERAPIYWTCYGQFWEPLFTEGRGLFTAIVVYLNVIKQHTNVQHEDIFIKDRSENHTKSISGTENVDTSWPL